MDFKNSIRNGEEMRKIKTVSNLIEKAEEKGFAKINGRYYGGQKMEKYSVSIENGKLELRHWGTTTLELDLVEKKITYYYGESKSDADSINTVLDHFNIEGKASYRPSINKFSIIGA